MRHRFYPFLSFVLLLSTLAALGWVLILKQQLQDNQQLAAAQLSAQRQANAVLETTLKSARDSTLLWQTTAQQARQQTHSALRQLALETQYQTAVFATALQYWEEKNHHQLAGGEWKTRVDVLMLYDKGLHRLPAEVYQCRGLQKLYLSGNPNLILPEIVPRLAHLPQLSELDLHACYNLPLPATIGQLSHLTHLNLNNNQLKSIPYEVSRLQHLTTLDLGFNDLLGLPTCVLLLSELTHLNLTANGIQELSPGIGALKKLTQLNLNGNRLHNLPPQIGLLTQLTDLDLSNNKLTSLPPAMAALKNLRKLDLHGNKIPESEREEIRKLLPADCKIRFEW